MADLVQLHATVADALGRLEPHFGPNYRLTLIARYVESDLEDADIVVTSDEFGELVACVTKRRDAEAPKGKRLSREEHRLIVDAIRMVWRAEKKDLCPGHLRAIRQEVLHDLLSMEGDARENAEGLLESMAPGVSGPERFRP